MDEYWKPLPKKEKFKVGLRQQGQFYNVVKVRATEMIKKQSTQDHPSDTNSKSMGLQDHP